jgi:hypothetical protein
MWEETNLLLRIQILDGPGEGSFVNLTSNLTMLVVSVIFAVFLAFSFQRMPGN